MAPLWVLALGSGAKSFAANPVIGSRRLNEMGLHVRRVQLAAWLANRRRSRLACNVAAIDRQAYERDGFVVKPNFLPQAAFEQLRDEVFDTDWSVRSMRQGVAETRRVPLDRAVLEPTHPVLAGLSRDPSLVSLIRYVASTAGQPIFSLQAVVVGQGRGDADPQAMLHADTFHSTAKAWLFLHDVGPDDGPFAYVPGSHKRTPERLAWEKQQSITAARNPVAYHARGSFRVGEADLRQLGLPRPRQVTVKANTLVIGDTSGFHARSPSRQPTCRVEIYATLRRNPFLPWIGLDPLSLPGLRDRSGSLSIRVLSALSKVGLAKMPWQPMDRMRIDAMPGEQTDEY